MFFLPAVAINDLKLSPDNMGLLYAATMLPFILFSVPAGYLLDALDPRKTLFFALLVAVLAELTIASEILTSSLSIGVICIASILASILLLISRLCYFSIVRRLYDESQRLLTNSRLVGNEQIAQISGTTIMGATLHFFSSASGIAISTLLIFVSFVFYFNIPKPSDITFIFRAENKESLLKSVIHALRIKQIKDLTIFSFSYNVFYGMLLSLYFFYAMNERSLSIFHLSLIAGISSLGNVVAAPLTRRVFSAAISSWRAVRLVYLITSTGAVFLFGVFIPSAHSIVTVMLFTCTYFIFYLATNLSAALAVFVRQELTTTNFSLLLGVGTTTNYAALALGSLLGGFAGKYAGVSIAMAVAVAGMTLVGMIAYGFPFSFNFFGKKSS